MRMFDEKQATFASRTRKRIAIVGPVEPFRGGIAKHTTQLARALKRRGDVDLRVISFDRLYPKVLFPGETDRCAKTARPDDLPVEYIVDTLDPRTWRRVAHILREWGADQIIVPAWTFFTAPALGVIARLCARNGANITMIAHNAGDHEASFWKSRLTDYQLSGADDILAHTSATANSLSKRFPATSLRVCPHPIFDHYPEPSTLAPRRAPLELLHFGLVRPYKGLDTALEALAICERRDIELSIVGEFWGDAREKIEAMIRDFGISDLVEIVDRYVSDEEAANFFARADAVLLPYRSSSGSGVIPLAYRYGKPVIVSDLPALTEVVRDRRTGWITPPGDASAIATLLRDIITAERTRSMGPAIAEARRALTWKRFVSILLSEPAPSRRALPTQNKVEAA